MPATTSLPTPPFVDIPGLRNFRDCGGYPVATNATDSDVGNENKQKIVRRGVLFRSSEPSKVTDEGIAILRDTLGITHVFDLRSQAELDRDAITDGRQAREWEGSKRVFVPVFLQEDYSPEAIATRFAHYSSEGSEGFVQAYGLILKGATDPKGAQPFAAVLRHLASPAQAPTPILAHCTAGKDRTGVLCALVLSLCGVPDDAVAHEYSLTDLGLGERREEFVGNLTRSGPLQGDRAAAERMVASRPGSMLGTLALIRREYGGVEKFVRDRCGLSDEEIEGIRRNLVVEADGGQQPVHWEEHRKLLA
ncbi:tyrosine phosphatase [Diaporthe amygdali]|uniref:tyrosine phosphatase n=1 Tax=Phomopsis amygdali TaxID=1214568 RepID=UPI0022FE6537|nr:tyrosine phosphatase [Diaporthe amygdali]KAJ0123614.1 tyrosine phosphatase [Diaporthe amygdali]